MARKHYRPEEIVAKLQQVEVLVEQGNSTPDLVQTIGVTEATEVGSGEADEGWSRRGVGEGRLRGAVTDLTLEKPVLKDADLKTSEYCPWVGRVWSKSRPSWTFSSVLPKWAGSAPPAQPKPPGAADDEAAVTAAIIDWSRQHGRTGRQASRRLCQRCGRSKP